MISTETQEHSNWFLKFFLCLLAIVGAINSVIYTIAPLLPAKWAARIIPVGLSMLLIAILFSVGFSIYWHYKAKKGKINSQKYRIWLTVLLRYWLAFHIMIFGFEKLFEVNFAFASHLEDALVNTLTGTELTWKYYGSTYGLAAIVGIFQIAGSIFLLFRRTVLLGVATLLPVLFNIVLINIFYGIGPITTFTSMLMTLGLCYLLLERKDAIIALFTKYKNPSPAVGNKALRAVLRVLCIVIPLVFIMYYRYDVHLSDKYFGKWKVDSMMRNGKKIAENAWEKDTSAWKVVYIEERGKIYYSPNPHMYVDSTSVLMRYQYDDTKNSLQVIAYERNPAQPDTIPVQINKFNGSTMQWNMVLYKDTIQMQLKKVIR